MTKTTRRNTLAKIIETYGVSRRNKAQREQLSTKLIEDGSAKMLNGLSFIVRGFGYTESKNIVSLLSLHSGVSIVCQKLIEKDKITAREIVASYPAKAITIDTAQQYLNANVVQDFAFMSLVRSIKASNWFSISAFWRKTSS
jgi:hypothetical protein